MTFLIKYHHHHHQQQDFKQRYQDFQQEQQDFQQQDFDKGIKKDIPQSETIIFNSL